jgi:hypothetical protein
VDQGQDQEIHAIRIRLVDAVQPVFDVACYVEIRNFCRIPPCVRLWVNANLRMNPQEKAIVKRKQVGQSTVMWPPEKLERQGYLTASRSVLDNTVSLRNNKPSWEQSCRKDAMVAYP